VEDSYYAKIACLVQDLEESFGYTITTFYIAIDSSVNVSDYRQKFIQKKQMFYFNFFRAFGHFFYFNTMQLQYSYFGTGAISQVQGSLTSLSHYATGQKGTYGLRIELPSVRFRWMYTTALYNEGAGCKNVSINFKILTC